MSWAYRGAAIPFARACCGDYSRHYLRFRSWYWCLQGAGYRWGDTVLRFYNSCGRISTFNTDLNIFIFKHELLVCLEEALRGHGNLKLSA